MNRDLPRETSITVVLWHYNRTAKPLSDVTYILTDVLMAPMEPVIQYGTPDYVQEFSLPTSLRLRNPYYIISNRF